MGVILKNARKTKKELLYIPNGNYLTFYLGVNTLGSFGEYVIRWNISQETVIEKILDGTFNTTFFERNGLPSKEQLEENHFEIVSK